MCNKLSVHESFKFNGVHFNEKELSHKAEHFINEGKDFEREIGQFLLDWFDNTDFISLTTSGTTGKPKLIKIKKQAMVNSAIATGTFFDLKSGDKALHCLPTKYIAGKMMIVRALVLGLEIDCIAPTSNLNKLLLSEQYDFTALVPLQAETNLDILHLFKKIIIGGAKISSLLSKSLQKIDCQIFETYGMTETVTHIAAKRVGEDTFTLLPNIKIALDNRDCLMIEAPNLLETAIITNDIVEIINERQFKWIGRYDNVINSGGIKLFPEQIESKLASTISQRFFITGLADEKLGQKVVLIVEGKSFVVDDNVFSSLDKYEKPKEIYFIDSFITTETTKIQIKKTLSKIGL